MVSIRDFPEILFVQEEGHDKWMHWIALHKN